MSKSLKKADLGDGWYASANEDGTYTIQSPDCGQRVNLPGVAVGRFCGLFHRAQAFLIDHHEQDHT